MTVNTLHFCRNFDSLLHKYFAHCLFSGVSLIHSKSLQLFLVCHYTITKVRHYVETCNSHSGVVYIEKG